MRNSLIIGLVLFSFLSCSKNSSNSHQTQLRSQWNPSQTFALIVGILEWQDNSLQKFPKTDRKDVQFKELLLRRGVPESNLVYLEDSMATRTQIRQSLLLLLNRAPKGSTFLFYFAGHGERVADQTVFMNYDVDAAHALETGVGADEIEITIDKHFKGDTVLLFADCCHSGGLAKTAIALGKTGFKAAALTSANELIGSTGNWTYTEGLIEIFRGKSEIDRKGVGTINYEQAKHFINQEMMYQENQLYGEGHSPQFDLNFTFSSTQPQTRLRAEDYFLADHVQVVSNGKWLLGRILTYQAPHFKIRFTDGDEVLTTRENIRRPTFRDIAIGTRVTVLCTAPKEPVDLTPATVIERAEKFYLVTTTHETAWSPKTWVPVECLN